MLDAQDPQRLDENKLKTLNEIVTRISRVAISSSLWQTLLLLQHILIESPFCYTIAAHS